MYPHLPCLPPNPSAGFRSEWRSGPSTGYQHGQRASLPVIQLQLMSKNFFFLKFIFPFLHYMAVLYFTTTLDFLLFYLFVVSSFSTSHFLFSPLACYQYNLGIPFCSWPQIQCTGTFSVLWNPTLSAASLSASALVHALSPSLQRLHLLPLLWFAFSSLARALSVRSTWSSL